MVEDSRHGVLALPGFTYDFEASELRSDAGGLVVLRPQCLAVLRCLATAAGRLVTKEELMATVWHEIVVTDDSLVQCITALRRALGDADHRVVQTEPKRGYRLQVLRKTPASAEPSSGWRVAAPQVRFATACDGVRLAYAVCGEGPPLVRAGRWMSHLELERNCLIVAPLQHELSRRFTLLCHDMRGQGLSDRGVQPRGPETMARDLLAVIDAAGFERFTLLGFGLVGVATATQFARLIPERVERLVLLSSSARGLAMQERRTHSDENLEAWRRLIADTWDGDTPLARQMMTTYHYPGATKEQMDSYNELQRRSSSSAGVLEFLVTHASIDVSDALHEIPWPTLVIHSPANLTFPFDEGRLVAAGIPGARFRTIESRNFLPLPGEPGFEESLRLIEQFVREGDRGQRIRADEDGAGAPRPAPGAPLRVIAGATTGAGRVRRRR